MELAYQLRRPWPVSKQRPPLLLLLHGVGGNELGLFQHVGAFDRRFLVLSLRAPHAMGPQQYRWFDVTFTTNGPLIDAAQAEASRVCLLQFINDAVMTFGADPRQVFLFGFSQGATLAYSALLTAPRKLRGGVMIAGRVLPDVAPLAAPRADLTHLTLLIQHGQADPVIPLANAGAARDLFADLGVALGYREYAASHQVTPDMVSEAAAFLQAQLNRTTHDINDLSEE